eukprot:CAMPEP_0118638352 /NCGR_PEP_ID=MMETSP0785-20121206/3634_1 /TAXON_ID=91992 /ORGANISM="Bolidomonas pacifica, Strain CCMP 1866" /LENGTH=810 /DNA_ID=CAMNT_0006529587 /DNA_START=206 /DNA_END=2641 /DNA_ORIENTATION=-
MEHAWRGHSQKTYSSLSPNTRQDVANASGYAQQRIPSRSPAAAVMDEEQRVRMMQKESVLNRNAQSITVRSDPMFDGNEMVTVPSDSKPGSREEQVKDGGMDFIGNRRTGTNSASDFTYSYPKINRSKPKTMAPPAGPPPGLPPKKVARAFNAAKSTTNKTAEISTGGTRSLPPSMPQVLKDLDNSSLMISELVHLASVSRPTFDVALIAAAITMGLGAGNKHQNVKVIPDPQGIWSQTQRSLIRASDLISRIRCFDVEAAPEWRTNLIKLAVTEVEGGVNFESFESFKKFNPNASKAVGKLFIWAYNTCVAANLLDEQVGPSHSNANNNDDISDESGSFDKKDLKSICAKKITYSKPSSPKENRTPSIKAPVARPMSSPNDQALRLDALRRRQVATSSPVDLEQAEMAARGNISPQNKSKSGSPSSWNSTSPSARNLVGAASPVPRPSTSPVSFLSDLNSMERDIYGSDATGTASEVNSDSNSPSQSSANRSMKSTSPTGIFSSDSDSDGTPGEGFTFSLGNLEKLTISMNNLDKLMEKTPRNSAMGGFSARDAIEEESAVFGGAGGGKNMHEEENEEREGGGDSNVHLMLQQWMMFPVPPQASEEGEKKAAKVEAKEEMQELEEEIIVEEKSSSSRGSRGSRGSSGSLSGSVQESLFTSSSRSSSGSSIHSSDSDYETDTDYDSSDDDEEVEGEVEGEVQNVAGRKVLHRPEPQKQKQRQNATQKPKPKYAPPPGPPPNRKEKKGTGNATMARGTIPPPSTPSPKKLKMQQKQRGREQQPPPRSLLQAARSKIAHPNLVHGAGVKKYL